MHPHHAAAARIVDNVGMTIRSPRPSRPSAWLLATGVAAAALFVLADGRPGCQALLYLGMTATQPFVIVRGIRRHRPACPAAWRVLAAGVTIYLFANAIWYGYPVVLHGTLPFPSVADGLFFASYACTATALVLLIRARSPRADRLGPIIDSALLTVVAAFVAWVYVLGPTATPSTGSPTQRIVALGYPLFDLALFALVTRMVFTRGRRSPAFWYVCAFVVMQLAADTGYSLTVLNGAFDYGHVLVAGWIVSYGLIGAAALHPTMSTLGAAPDGARGSASAPMRRLVIVAAAALLVPVVTLAGGQTDHTLAYVTALALFVLSLARMAVIVRELQSTAAVIEGRERELRATVSALNRSEEDLAYQARHDSLTGLPNRAHFVHRLRRAVGYPGRPP
jgi:hypothetical protein